MDEIIKLLEKFDNLKLDSKIVILVIICALLFLFSKMLKYIFILIKDGINITVFINSINKTLRIIKEYELKTIAGFINLTTSLLLLFITIGMFLTASVAGFFGLSENVTPVKIIFIFLTIIATFSSLWILYKFDQHKELVAREA